MKRNLFGIMLLSGISILPKANAQTTYEEMEQLTVNEQVTTVITASEPIRFVDISTEKIAGDPAHRQHYPPETEGGRTRGRRSAGHRDHSNGTLPHAICVALHDKSTGRSNG